MGGAFQPMQRGNSGEQRNKEKNDVQETGIKRHLGPINSWGCPPKQRDSYDYSGSAQRQATLRE